MSALRKQPLPASLRKGGSIPYGISPIYYYNSAQKRFDAFRTLKKQPRTLHYSLEYFEYKEQLFTEFPSLKLAALDDHRRSDEMQNLQFNHDHDDNDNETLSDLQRIFTPFNLYQTCRLFRPTHWKFGGMAYELDEIPSATDMSMSSAFSEICLAGQSNAGKSSIINGLMGSIDFHQGFAVVSKKAGRTRMMNFYNLNKHLTLVDLMGYGFALHVDKRIREYWSKFMRKYFTMRMEHHLKHVFVLIDIDFFVKRFKKHPDSNNVLGPKDREMFKFLDECYVPYSLILTKVDNINSWDHEESDAGIQVAPHPEPNDMQRFDKILADLADIFDSFGMMQPFVHITSARLGFGVTELQCMMSHLGELYDKDKLDIESLDFTDIMKAYRPRGGE